MDTNVRHVLSVTFIIDPGIHDRWAQWCSSRFLPQFRGDERMGDILVSRVQSSGSEGQLAFSVLLTTLDEEDLLYSEERARELMDEDLFLDFGESCLPVLSRLIEEPGL